VSEDKKLISIAIPIKNEFSNLQVLIEALGQLADSHPKYDFEFVFTDNHSDDSSWEKLKEISLGDSRIRGVRFSKDFGFQNSILENYRICRGDAVIQLDADLQDPPGLIGLFLENWERGFHVVYGIRRRPEEWVLLRKFRDIGYFAINLLSESPIPKGAGDFRLLDRKVITALLSQNHSKPYLRGMVAGMGFDQLGLIYVRNARKFGESKFPARKLIGLGLNGIINHSTIPLRLATYAGGALLVLSTIASVYSVASYIMADNLPRGFTSLQLVQFLTIGINSFFLGIIGEYILRIYRIVRNDPRIIVEEELN
jgi:glycosyltransferase involved in cell wall biosynthesis